MRPGLRLCVALVGLVFAGGGSAHDLRLDEWRASIDPETLEITATLDDRDERIVVAKGGARRKATDVTVSEFRVAWTMPELGIRAEFEVSRKQLFGRFTATGDAKLVWPESGGDAPFNALILPEGSGLYVPNDDAAWRKRMTGHCADLSGGLLMPFWSHSFGNGSKTRTFTYHVRSDLRSELCLEDRAGRLAATLTHDFQRRDGGQPYEIEIWLGGASPIAPALEYRERLNAAGKFPTLTDKIRGNGQVAKLAGAVHMYTWGDGRNLEFVADLVALGVRRAWIGYDQDPNGEQTKAGPEFVDAAKAAGYLVGPYDTFNNGQDPKTGDFVSRWPGRLYPDGCIVNRDGRPRTGFAGRGCELSSEALRLAEPALKPLAGRIDSMLRDGANSYFLDVDAFGELHDDYAPAHPLTVFQDRANRLARLQTVRDRGVVLGSEEGVGWSVSLLDFAHGAGGTRNAAIWAEKKTFGKWWPPDRPGVFFQTLDPSAEFRASRYDAAYRLPLYQAAFHDAVVATDRWDVPMNKFPSLATTRQLIDVLHGQPTMWAMDRRTLKEWRESLATLQQFFEPLHGAIASAPMASFEWLTSDRLVQRTRFGNVVELTANFGKQPVGGVAPGCLMARWVAPERLETFCPKGRSPVAPAAAAQRKPAD